MTTVKEIVTAFANCSPDAVDGLIALHREDARKGVITAIARATRRRDRHMRQLDHLRGLSAFDDRCAAIGRVVGIDEAGRGPLAGPVAAAACVIDFHSDLIGLDDSKQLSAATRARLFDIIVARAKGYGVVMVDAAAIDSSNILLATQRAMRQALTHVSCDYDLILTDYVDLADQVRPVQPIVGGDGKSLAIAAASVLAKVTRDRLMQQYHEQYPNYGFDRHKGYGTPDHIAALRRYGPCPIHRRSFIKAFI